MRTITTLAASALLVIGLTGCTVAVSEPDEATSSQQPQATEQTDQTEQEETASEPAAEEPTETSWSSTTAAERESAIELATTTMTCSGELVLGASYTGQVVKIDGPCDHLVLHMDGGVVIAGDVTTLDVYGVGTVGYIDSVDTITATGSANVISWAGATPEITDTGVGNVLRAG